MIGIWKHFFSRDWKLIVAAAIVVSYNIVGGFQESWWLGLMFMFVFLCGLPSAIYLIDCRRSRVHRAD